MPRVDDLLDRLGQAKYISALDLTKGYWQVPVHPESRQQTVFITPFGKYVLASPNEECPFMLQTDASGVDIAGVLSQEDDSGDD